MEDLKRERILMINGRKREKWLKISPLIPK
jgi:hypothetical protein